MTVSPSHAPARTPARACLRWAIGAVVLYACFAAILLVTAGRGDPAWFIHLGSERIPVALARRVLGPGVAVPQLDGHDGRFFWVQARDPLVFHPRADAANLDRPAYRAQRMAYPLLAAPWRAMGEYGLVWGLVITNLLAVGVGVWFTTALALDLGAPARVSLAFTLNPVTVVAVAFDTGDALALAAIMAGLWFLHRRSWIAAVAAATVAALAKEPSLLAFGAVAALVGTIPTRTRVWLVAIPAGAAGGWGLYERWRLGWPPTAIQEFTAPLYGYLDAYRRGWRPVGNYSDAVIAVMVLGIAVAVVLRWSRRRTLVLSAALPFALMVPFLSAQVLDLADNSLRALGPAITLLAIDVYAASSAGNATLLQPAPQPIDFSP